MARPTAVANRILPAVCLLISPWGPAWGQTPPANAWQAKADSLVALQSAQKTPVEFGEEALVWTGGDFDVQEYFSVLDRLSMEPGYLLDYVYCLVPSRPDGTPEPYPIGGSPRLYARVADQEPLTACTDDIDPAAYLRHIRTDGSEEGFFQLAVLEILAEQFYLFWHAHSDDDRVVCTWEAIEAAMRVESPFEEPFSPEQRAAARAIDTTPVVELGEEQVTVVLVSFTKWGGFFRQTYEMNRAFPHAPLVRRKERLVEYQVGIIF